MTRILVTGGGGLIGQEVTRQLILKGLDVNVLDLWPHLIAIKGATYFKGSVLSTNDINKAMEGCTHVFHLAAILGVSKALQAPVECLDVNMLGTRNVLECCQKNKVQKVVFSSSSEVYGEPETIPIKESAILRPKSEYGVSKYIGEEYLKAFKKQYGLDYSIVRFFNIYGSQQRHAWVMPIFLNNALLGKKLKIYGEGSQTRSFCFVEDAARGIIKTMLSEEANGDVFNIGNAKEPITMKELAQKTIQLIGAKEEQIEFVQLNEKECDRSKEREIHKRIPDTKKAKDILGFEAKISLEEGMKRIIEFKKARMDKVRQEVEIAEQALKLNHS